MEKIDLTKCINLRYRARIGDHHVIGRIGFDEDGYVALLHNGVKPWRGNSVEEIMKIHGMEDFEIVPRDPEAYRDWQVGDVIYNLDDEGNTVSGEDEMCRVIFRSGELVAIAENYSAVEADIYGCYTCSQLYREGWRLVLTDIEQQIIEEKKKYEPQDGDIVAWQTKESQVGWAISIYEKKKNSYMTLFITGICRVNEYPLNMEVIRPATEDEKRMLFDAMAKEGKRWNAEKKVVEDIPKPYEFKKGEPVLVRNSFSGKWKIMVFLASINNEFVVQGVDIPSNWNYCIPYNERTMHLLGTTEDYKR